VEQWSETGKNNLGAGTDSLVGHVGSVRRLGCDSSGGDSTTQKGDKQVAKTMDTSVLDRLRAANTSLVLINRIANDEEFNRDLGAALEEGDGKALSELLAPMGVTELSLSQGRGGAALNFNLGVVVCVTVTIQVCKQF
jgi:hypothetical protein